MNGSETVKMALRFVKYVNASIFSAVLLLFSEILVSARSNYLKLCLLKYIPPLQTLPLKTFLRTPMI